MRVVHYLNQFFAGFGGEDCAGMAPVRLGGAVGPGRALGLEVVATLACGDDYFGEHEEEALAELLRHLEAERPDVLVCGPSFGSGRYGYACGVLAREAARRGVPAVCAMEAESPGVLAAEGAAYIVPTGSSVAAMRETLPRVARLAARLGSDEPIGGAADEGYLPRGLRRNELCESTGAARAVEMLLAKLRGETYTEVEAPGDLVPPPPPLAELSTAVLALVSEAGCVPRGNPDRLESNRAHRWLRYSLKDVDSLRPGEFESVHGGYDVGAANADPNRLVPLDVVRELEREGRIGRLHPEFYTTTGNSTPVATAAKFGREIAQELHAAQVQAVLLTGT